MKKNNKRRLAGKHRSKLSSTNPELTSAQPGSAGEKPGHRRRKRVTSKRRAEDVRRSVSSERRRNANPGAAHRHRFPKDAEQLEKENSRASFDSDVLPSDWVDPFPGHTDTTSLQRYWLRRLAGGRHPSQALRLIDELKYIPTRPHAKVTRAFALSSKRLRKAVGSNDKEVARSFFLFDPAHQFGYCRAAVPLYRLSTETDGLFEDVKRTAQNRQAELASRRRRPKVGKYPAKHEPALPLTSMLYETTALIWPEALDHAIALCRQRVAQFRETNEERMEAYEQLSKDLFALKSRPALDSSSVLKFELTYIECVGRLFTTETFWQSMPKDIRRVLFKHGTIDLDFRRCHPAIAVSLYPKLVPSFAEYLENLDEFVDFVIEYYDISDGTDEDGKPQSAARLVKEMVNAILNGMKLNRGAPSFGEMSLRFRRDTQEECPRLIQMVEEAAQITRQLAKDHPGLIAGARKWKKEKNKKRYASREPTTASLIYRVFNHYERQALEVLAREIPTFGVNPAVLMHDGMLVQVTDLGKITLSERALLSVEESIFRQTGLRLSISQEVL